MRQKELVSQKEAQRKEFVTYKMIFFTVQLSSLYLLMTHLQAQMNVKSVRKGILTPPSL